MLADLEVDVVYIALPHTLHAEWMVRAAEAGKHARCWPFLATTTLSSGPGLQNSGQNASPVSSGG